MRKVLLHEPCKDGLYPLLSSASSLSKIVFSVTRFSINLWHNRLGHPAHDIVLRIIRENNLPCASFHSTPPSVCDPCLCAKACQLAYSLSSSHATAPLELILMFGAMRTSLFVARNIMLLLLMTIVNSHGSICSIANLKFFNISLNFNLLLSAYLITKSSQSSLTGWGGGGGGRV
jgi:hypothetical protein